MTTTAQLRVPDQVEILILQARSQFRLPGIFWMGRNDNLASRYFNQYDGASSTALTGQLASSGETITLVGCVVGAYHENRQRS